MWPHSCPPLPLWKPLLRMMFRLSWRRLRNLWSQIPATGLRPRLAHIRPRSRSHSPLPKAAPSRPRGSILLNQRGPTGLSFKSSPVVPPDRCRVLLPPLTAPRRLPPAAAVPEYGWHESCAATLCSRSRPLLGRQVRGVVLQAPLKHDNAGGTHRRRVRRATKRLMWCEIQC